MKTRLIAILLFTFALSACGNDSNEDLQPTPAEAVQDSIPTLSGEFIFLAGDAVLKGEDFVYGVNIDSISRDLAAKVKIYKEDQFDMIPVKVKAKIVNNPKPTGWEELIEIREVISISSQELESEEETSNK